ncbi:MFS transporter [Desulfovibrio sp. OttesenSCG-928-I05]|nr:MFS transporter [Desulfovibrio sp. OttesenSCG-928-I05]
MSNELSKEQRPLFWAVLSVSTITILSSTAVSPALAGIKAAFPDLADSTIQLVLLIPPLCIIPACFLCGPMAERFGRKRVLLFGIALYLLGGLGAGLMPTFSLMLAARGLLGVGCGFITPMAQALIGPHFKGSLRERMLGYSASASYMMGIVASFTVSWLAAVNWRLSFCIYLVALVVLALNILYLPGDLPPGKTASGALPMVPEAAPAGGEAIRPRPERLSPNWRAMLVILAMGLVNVAFYIFSVSIALFMAQEGIGGESSSGGVVAVFMLSGFFVGLVTARIRESAGPYTNAVAALMMGGGYLVLALGTSVPVLCLGAAGVGGSYSIFYSGIFLQILHLSRTPRENTRLVTYATAALFLGQFVSVALMQTAETLTGFSGYRFRFAFLAAMLGSAAAGVIVYALYRKRARTDAQ